MPKYDLILFDLDGTLVDSAPGITASVAFALSHFGIFPETREELLRFIGPPLSDSFRRFYGFSEERAGEAVDLYRVRYRESGVYEFSVYEGIEDALSALNAAGLKTLLPAGAFYLFTDITSTGLTSQEFAVRLLEEKSVACVPGSAFGACGEGFVRLSYATSYEKIQEAAARISAFAKDCRKRRRA